jgi:hypothetical protein
MARNIVLCCDGTSNEYGDRPTNVLKIYTVHTGLSELYQGAQVSADPCGLLYTYVYTDRHGRERRLFHRKGF